MALWPTLIWRDDETDDAHIRRERDRERVFCQFTPDIRMHLERPLVSLHHFVGK